MLLRSGEVTVDPEGDRLLQREQEALEIARCMESKKPSVPIRAWLAAVLSLQLVACGGTNECSNVVISEFPSPDIRFIQQLLGHEKLDTTAIYTEVSIKQLQEVHARCHPSAQDPGALLNPSPKQPTLPI